MGHDLARWCRERHLFWVGIVGCFAINTSYSHERDARGPVTIPWSTETVSRIYSSQYNFNNLGYTTKGKRATIVQLGENECWTSSAFNIDVSDDFAYDISGDIQVHLSIVGDASLQSVLLAYDAEGGPRSVESTIPDRDADRQFSHISITLPSARLANRGSYDTDILLLGQGATVDNWTDYQEFALCDVAISRAKSAPVETSRHGELVLRFRDEKDSPTAVRFGIYDAEGKSVLPSSSSLPISSFGQVTRSFLLSKDSIWPSENRYVQYGYEDYKVRVPAGTYSLVVSKGIEYRNSQRTFQIAAGERKEITIKMKRFVDMPGQGWLSGDVHVHSDQNLESEDSGIRLIASAEDVHVANVLMMGNVARTYFDRYPIEEPDISRTGHHAVVEGQEDPRTTILGHTIHLNLTSFVRYPFDYLSYHKVFESVGSQGGISGFAHLTSRAHNAEVGMALLTPFDLVDFAEVMQANVIDMQIWTDFLNLGFKITPVAGSDFPYLGVPGSVRTYVRVNNRSNSHGWFEGLEKGAVFVTNGPVTDFSINGVGIGGEVSIVSGEEIKIVGSAKLNPDYGSLRRIDLITQGEVVATSLADVGAPTIEISSSYSPTSSGWYFIRVYGDNPLISAMTAPIYVIVDGNRRTWNRDKVPELTQRLIDRLDWLKNVSLEEVTDNEPWETMPVWQLDLKRQITSISGKVHEAQEFLKKLSSSARSAE